MIGPRSRVVLGLCAFTHDSSAALIRDGRLTGFAEEERLNGIKHTNAYPDLSVDWVLREAELGPNDVTAVAYNFDGPRFLRALPATVPQLLRPVTRGRALPRARSFLLCHRRFQQRMAALRGRFPNAEVRPVSHHRAHGLYAFAASGYDEAAVLVADSLGETDTTAIAHARRTGSDISYRTLHRIGDPASLGYAYGGITQHLGWRRGDEEGTVMALAALGQPDRFRDLLARAIPLTANGFVLDPALLPLRVVSSRYPRVSARFIDQTGPPRREGDPIEEVHRDLAAALQERTEQVMVHLARRARDLTASRLLCLGGGVALNCVSIGAIAASGLFDEVFVPPAPGDSGTAIGAALAANSDLGAPVPTGVTGSCYLGPKHPDVAMPEHPRPGMTARRPPCAPAAFLARQLADGRIVGLFRGKLEAGPRALGNRSILASPLLPDVVARLNATVKFREPFRPFAPVVLAEDAAEFFTLSQPAPYMSIASAVTAHARATIPAVVHVNGTARVQTLTAAQNPFLAEVLRAFRDLTGVPVLINTSLNVKGKPICGDPDMALDCLAESGLDALMLEGWWITK